MENSQKSSQLSELCTHGFIVGIVHTRCFFGGNLVNFFSKHCFLTWKSNVFIYKYQDKINDRSLSIGPRIHKKVPVRDPRIHKNVPVRDRLQIVNQLWWFENRSKVENELFRTVFESSKMNWKGTEVRNSSLRKTFGPHLFYVNVLKSYRLLEPWS